MGIFDVRCAVSGVVIRTEEVLVFPVVERTDGEWFAAALPVRGGYDGYGRPDPLVDDRSVDVLAKSFPARAVFPGSEKKPRGKKKLIERLVASDEFPPALDERPVRVAYVLAGVYEALVAKGAADAEVSLRLRGKDVTGLFEEALVEWELAWSLYRDAPSNAEKHVRLAVTALARSGLGRRPLHPVEDEDRLQHDDEVIEDVLSEARERFAGEREILQALDAYAEEMRGEVAKPVAPVLSALLPDALGAVPRGDGAFELPHDRAQVTIDIRPSRTGERLWVWVALARGNGSRWERPVAMVEAVSSDPDAVAAEALGPARSRLESTMAALLALTGEPCAPETVIALAREDRWFLDELTRSPHVSPENVRVLGLALKEFPYTDDVRLAVIEILNRADCPSEVARAFESHPSRSIKEAVAQRLARG